LRSEVRNIEILGSTQFCAFTNINRRSFGAKRIGATSAQSGAASAQKKNFKNQRRVSKLNEPNEPKNPNSKSKRTDLSHE
jgi:hypothetical protein